MKLTDFPETDQNLIKFRLDAETESWRHSSVWWKDKEGIPHKQMQEWNRKFIEFRDSVLADGDIEEAFFAWSGQDLILPDLNKINAPQYGFYSMYKTIKSSFDKSQEEEVEISCVFSGYSSNPWPLN